MIKEGGLAWGFKKDYPSRFTDVKEWDVFTIFVTSFFFLYPLRGKFGSLSKGPEEGVNEYARKISAH